jgi:hypothetical protein
VALLAQGEIVPGRGMTQSTGRDESSGVESSAAAETTAAVEDGLTVVVH